MDYIRRADILKCRALAATPFFHDSYGYTEGKVVENKNPNIMYLVSTYRGRATPHHTQLPNNARNQQAIYTTPNPTRGNTQHTPCNHRTNKMRLQNPYTKNKQLHEIKAPKQKHAIVTRNRQQCANRKQRDPRKFAGSNYRNQNLSSTTAPLQWFHIERGGDEQTRHKKERKKGETRKESGPLVVLSHIVSPQRFGAWSIYTLLVEWEHTYLGGVDRWSRWPMA